eukprot:7924893-Heterocapsa_arctica.AAC.1
MAKPRPRSRVPAIGMAYVVRARGRWPFHGKPPCRRWSTCVGWREVMSCDPWDCGRGAAVNAHAGLQGRRVVSGRPPQRLGVALTCGHRDDPPVPGAVTGVQCHLLIGGGSDGRAVGAAAD